MGRDNSKTKYSKLILSKLEKLIREGVWDTSAYLKSIGKRLNDYQQQLTEAIEREDLKGGAKNATGNVDKRLHNENFQEIYLSLYSADGTNLAKWEKILLSLPKQAITRPAYKHESELKTLIRSKRMPNNEAYVAIDIDKIHIRSPDPRKIPRDRLGHELLILQENAVKVENITRFYHTSGVYRFTDKHLIKEQRFL